MATHIVYKTTCKINGKIYVGVHKLNSRSKNYLGSGLCISAAIMKYGRENFVREVLSEHDSAEDAYRRESEIVNEEFLKRSDVYNIGRGGRGGILTKTHRERISKALLGRKKSELHKRRIGKAVSGRNNGLYGKKHTGDLKRFGHQKRCRPVMINGVTYESSKAAAAAHNVGPSTIVNWLKNGKAELLVKRCEIL